MTRRDFLKAAALAGLTAGAPSLLPATESTMAPRSNEELLAGTAERIARYRQAPGEIVVRRRGGQPVRGANVRVEQVKHAFLFGSNGFGLFRYSDAALHALYQQRFAALFNAATLGFYWSSFEPRQGEPDYAHMDRAVAWCQEHLITPKGHPLAWDHDVSSPKWLPLDLSEVGELSSARVTEIVRRFRGRIDLWDVVNEPTHLGNAQYRKEAANHMGQWAAWLGPREFSAGHLKLAREANPAAQLVVNEYQLDGAFLGLLETLREHGRWLFDIIGVQSHMHDTPWPMTRVWDVCETYRILGKPLHFTETTIVSGPRLGAGENFGPTEAAREEQQAKYVEDFYTLLFSHPAVEGIYWWDLSDLGAWQGAAAGWLRKDMTPKPVYERMHELIKRRWWTRAEGSTDRDGKLSVTAFRGLHRVTVTMPDGRSEAKVVTWNAPGRQRVELIVA